MNRLLLPLLLGVSSWVMGTVAWSPAASPLMTRFSKDVHPDQIPEYPRPQLKRGAGGAPDAFWQPLNGLYEFDHTVADLSSPPFGQKLAHEILVPYPVESPLSGIRNVTSHGYMFYRKEFTPIPCEGQRTLLTFEAVDWNTTVWINSKLVGVHAGGYDAFTFDITEAVAGGQGLSEVLVGVFDPTENGTQATGKQSLRAFTDPHAIKYSPTSGIWGTVWQECVPKQAYLTDLTYPEPDVDSSTVTYHAQIAGEAADISTLTVNVMYNKEPVANATIAWSPDQTTTSVSVVIPADALRLWSADDPALYDAELVLKGANGQVIDQVTSYFGMRKVSIGSVSLADGTSVPVPLLNDKFVFQMGTLDQGFWPDGNYAAPTDEALKSDLVAHKDLGFNMVRKHTKVEPRRWNYHCDTLGLWVWQDIPSRFNYEEGQALDQWTAEMTRHILLHRGSPSIVQWIVFNEGWGQTPGAPTETAVNQVLALDSTRLVNDATGGHGKSGESCHPDLPWTGGCFGNITDLHHYSPPASPVANVAANRPAILGEYGGILLVPAVEWAKGKCHGYATVNSSEELTALYETYSKSLLELKDTAGLSGAVFTQISDTETECNGLLTYDRLMKSIADRMKVANGALYK